ncbi:unnamed protein product [Owenia fusiformis]|uniref:Uncharacterized protein n=1 Tax=Owenia fusiformis TaxID=6347 RepID=A0A8J1UB59_OWEFU|nr:unnamed protein product [Owenia fusiformis]
MKVYHYTSEAGIKGIKSSMKIKQSTDKKKDAMLGEGVYFTTMTPRQHSKEEIIRNNWDGAVMAMHTNRLDWAIELDIPRSRLMKNESDGRDIFAFPGDVNLNDFPHQFIKVDEDLNMTIQPMIM